MSAKTVGVFFGAGAEVGYGMPTGGEFALNILRRDPIDDKELFRQMRDSIDPMTPYATSWLPDHYTSKRISVFGKSEKTTIFRNSFQKNKSVIFSYIDDFDSHAEKILAKNGLTKSGVNPIVKKDTGKEIGDVAYTNLVLINVRLHQNVNLFQSGFFSVALELLKLNKGSKTANDLEAYVRSVLQMYVGAMGQDLVNALNQEIFTTAPDDIGVFDDLTGLFRIEIEQAGLDAYHRVMESPSETIRQDSAIYFMCDLIHQMIEEILAACLDYQSLVDDNFRYLYQPRSEWARFCKMALFLMSTRRYIIEQYKEIEKRMGSSDGYYHDLAEKQERGQIQINVAGTSNYTEIAERIFEARGTALSDLIYLHGSTSMYYDPYKNMVINGSHNYMSTKGKFLFPFLFTQSGIKPLTSVSMSRKYVDLFDKMCDSEIIVVVGFGFNGDDGHINGLFRELIDDRKRTVFVTVYHGANERFDENQTLYDLQRKIRCRDRDRIRVIPVTSERRGPDGRNWLDILLDDAQHIV